MPGVKNALCARPEARQAGSRSRKFPHHGSPAAGGGDRWSASTPRMRVQVSRPALENDFHHTPSPGDYAVSANRSRARAVRACSSSSGTLHVPPPWHPPVLPESPCAETKHATFFLLERTVAGSHGLISPHQRRSAQLRPGISRATPKRRAKNAMLSSPSHSPLMTESRGALPFKVAFVLVIRRSPIQDKR